MNNLEEALKRKTRIRKPSTVAKKAAKEKESDLQKQVLFYFEDKYRKQYPDCQIVTNPLTETINSVLFGIIKDVKLRKQVIQKIFFLAKILGYKAMQPDLLFLQPNKDYIGLAIELKTLEANPFYVKYPTKLKKNKHTKPQKEYLDKLSNVGYFATFGVGLENCKKIIDNYFQNT